jgi:pyrroloquinoline quinone (PQQ) biosynthesis protein C
MFGLHAMAALSAHTDMAAYKQSLDPTLLQGYMGDSNLYSEQWQMHISVVRAT